jgi:hypothetical protein
MRFSDFDAYLRADHLQHSTTVTIERFEKITTHPRRGRTELALAVHFRGKQKPLILSTLNRRKLAAMFGDDTGAAIGKSVQLAVEQVSVAGQVKSVIRIRPAIAAAGNTVNAVNAAQPTTVKATAVIN